LSFSKNQQIGTSKVQNICFFRKSRK